MAPSASCVTLSTGEDDRRQAMLLEMKSIRIGRDVGELGQIPLDDDALVPITQLPPRHFDPDLQHVVSDAVGRHHLHRRRVVGAGAQVDGEAGLSFEHEDRNVALGEDERGQQAHGAGADDDDGLHRVYHLCLKTGFRFSTNAVIPSF